QREFPVEADGETVEHDRVLQLLREVLRLQQPGVRREQRFGEIETRRHETEKALVAGALALVAQHPDQERLVLLRQRLALVEPVRRAAHLASESRERIALGVDASPERPELVAPATLGIL